MKLLQESKRIAKKIIDKSEIKTDIKTGSLKEIKIDRTNDEKK